jgi:hypothetical protein
MTDIFNPSLQTGNLIGVVSDPVMRYRIVLNSFLGLRLINR